MRANPRSRRFIETRNTVAAYSVLSIFAIIMILPFVIMVSTGLKPMSELFMVDGFHLFPKNPQPSNYIEAMQSAAWGRYFFNSIFVTFVATAGSLFINSLGGFSLGVLKYPGRDVLFLLLLIGIMVPFQALIVPQYILLRSIPLAGGNNLLGRGGTGWLNTYSALIVPQLAGSFGVFLCRQYFLGVPYELYESAKVDGAKPMTAFMQIYLPLSKPVLTSLAILKSVHVWNDFFYPLIMTSSDRMRTVQLGLQTFQGYALNRWDLMMAATTLVALPIIIAFLLLQRQFVQSALSSGLKG